MCPILFRSNFFVIFVPFKNKEWFWEMFIDFIYQNLYLFYVFTKKFKQTHKEKTQR